MDPNNLNNTDSVPGTQNPQDTANPGASNAEDFQSTAPSDALNEEAENLSVERTGEPVTDASPTVADSTMSYWWIGVLIIGAVLIVWVVYRLLKEEIEVFTPDVSEKASATKITTATKASTAKKTTRSGKKKSAAKKKTKKSTKRR